MKSDNCEKIDKIFGPMENFEKKLARFNRGFQWIPDQLEVAHRFIATTAQRAEPDGGPTSPRLLDPDKSLFLAYLVGITPQNKD